MRVGGGGQTGGARRSNFNLELKKRGESPQRGGVNDGVEGGSDEEESERDKGRRGRSKNRRNQKI